MNNTPPVKFFIFLARQELTIARDEVYEISGITFSWKDSLSRPEFLAAWRNYADCTGYADFCQARYAPRLAVT